MRYIKKSLSKFRVLFSLVGTKQETV